MSNNTDYENPKMKIIIYEKVEIIRTSLINGGANTGNVGELPEVTDGAELP